MYKCSDQTVISFEKIFQHILCIFFVFEAFNQFYDLYIKQFSALNFFPTAKNVMKSFNLNLKKTKIRRLIDIFPVEHILVMDAFNIAVVYIVIIYNFVHFQILSFL